MNITFIVIIFALAVIIYLSKHLININTKGIKGLVWFHQILIFLILLEAILFSTDLYTALPHFYLITFPLRFLVLPVLIHIGLRTRRYNKIPDFLAKNYFFVIACIAFLVLIPKYTLDTDVKLILIGDSPMIVRALLWSLLMFSIMLFITFRREMKILFSKMNPPSYLLGTAMVSFLAGLILSVIWPDSIYQIDLITFGIIAVSLLVFNKIRLPKTKKKDDASLILALDDLIKEKKLYQNPRLTLTMVSENIGTTSNEISRVINTYNKIGFNEYINRFRVNEVIAMITNEDYDRFTLEAIAKMAGFSSTTTFNKSFKQITGKTPKSYRILTKS